MTDSLPELSSAGDEWDGEWGLPADWSFDAARAPSFAE